MFAIEPTCVPKRTMVRSYWTKASYEQAFWIFSRRRCSGRADDSSGLWQVARVNRHVADGLGCLGNVSDLDVTEHVKTALQQNDALKGFDIGVVTLKGDVRLTGVVSSQAQIDEAIKIARAADGAHTVHDELTIKK
jgi:osmotically-inducible protein OsmY